MSSLVVDANITSQWHTLVTEAQARVGVSLNEDLESYLVFLLMRFCNKPEMAGSVLALDYLVGSTSTGQVRKDRLRDVGDQCLLYSGLFPKRAERRRVRISYFVDLGRSAYLSLSDIPQAAMAMLYANLAEGFVMVMDTLQAMRSMDEQTLALDPIQAMELWQDTGSQHARAVLRAHSDATPFAAEFQDNFQGSKASWPH